MGRNGKDRELVDRHADRFTIKYYRIHTYNYMYIEIREKRVSVSISIMVKESHN